MSPPRIEDRATALRRAFDESFASAPAEQRAATEDFLAIRVAGDPFAVRVASVARLTSAPKIVALPSRRPAVLGVAAIRGALVSVHSMAVLLGYGADAGTHRWVALAASADAVGLAFDELDGFLRVPRGGEGALENGGVTRPIVDVDAIVRALVASPAGRGTVTTGDAGPARSNE